MTNEEIKTICEQQYEVIKNAKDRLNELRAICKHEKTFNGNYSWRIGSVSPAEICFLLQFSCKIYNMSINVKKIGSFLKSMDGAEYQYLCHCIGVRNSIQSLIKRYNITKEEFCKKFEIKPSVYENFIMGNFNYTVHNMADLNSFFMELETEALKDKAPFQLVK